MTLRPPEVAVLRFCPGGRPFAGMAALSGLARDAVKEDAIELGCRCLIQGGDAPVRTTATAL